MIGTPGTLSGTFAGRYSIEYELGHGATATVYLARDNQRNRKVAIKILRPELAQSVGAERFLREIKVNEQLSHPHIVPVLDSGEWEGQLYFVLPHMEGGSLRVRMQRDKQLGIEEAVAIARTIAGALDYAHKRGLIHRDVKPENILFTGGQACLADFGIARAIERTIDESTTSTGLVRGTPAYMSPEQASGSKQYDGRSDIYSLGCVLYEMIAGIPAFIGPTPEAVIAQRFQYSPRELRVYRHSVPPALEAAIQKALAMTAADRYATAGEFATALETAQRVSRIEPRTSGPTIGFDRTKRVALAGTALFVVAVIAVLSLSSWAWPALRDGLVSLGWIGLDTTRVLVAPLQFTDSAGAAASAETAQRLRAVLEGWDGIDVVDARATARVIGDARGELTLERALRAARTTRARFVVWGSTHPEERATRLEIHLYDARSGGGGRRANASLLIAGPHDPTLTASARRAVATLLAGVEAPEEALRAAGTTQSLGAWRAYVRGHRALKEWRLAAAESAFAASAAADTRFPAGRAWLGQTMVWNRRGTRSDWRRHGEDAVMLGELDTVDALIARSIVTLGRRQDRQACATYSAVLARDSLSAVGWLGLGDCQALDSVVVRDARSPSGFAFRGNLTRAMAAYERVVGLHSGAYAALPYWFIERLLLTQSDRYRHGIAEGNASEQFEARPAASGDSIAYVPRLIVGATLGPEPARFEEGLRRNQARLFSYVTTWKRRAPGSDAYEAFASVQEARAELTGPAAAGGALAALAALDSAYRLTNEPEARARIATSRVRVLLKAGDFAAARAVADSLLANARQVSAREAHWLAGLAALTGRIDDAVRLARLGQTPPVEWDTLAPALADPATRLLLRSAAGVCDQRAAESFRDLEDLIDSYAAPAQRAAMRYELLNRARYLAIPCIGTEKITVIESRTIWDRMNQRLARHDLAGARAALDSALTPRRNRPPGGMALDFTFREAWVLATIGDSAAAMRHLDLTLNALPTLNRFAVWELVQAATVGRAMAWRAELALAREDLQNARRWATAVLALWMNADAELQPVVSRMRAISGSR